MRLVRDSMKEYENKLTVYDPASIQRKICSIRDIQVMLDRDLSELYQVKSIRLREQVKRNIKRFPPEFMFQLTEDEVDFMVSQNAIPSKQHLGGASLKDLGKKWFAFSNLDKSALELLENLKKVVADE